MMTTSQDILDRLDRRLADLPILPALAVQLLKLDPQDDRYFDRVLAYAHSDPGFATRLLQQANAAMATHARSLVSINAALLRVGARAAVEQILADSATRVFPVQQPWERNIWVHSILVAWLMRRLAPMVVGHRIDANEAYVFGLLHDIGRFVLHLEAPDTLSAIDEGAWDSPAALAAAEIAACGYTHSELGYLALRKWGLPDDLALAARHHHDVPATTSDAAPDSLVLLLRDVDALAMRAAHAGPEWFAPPADGARQFFTDKMVLHYRGDIHDLVHVVRNAIDEATRSMITLNLELR
jgi:putative nucleotidyltransferase with HDIG domain